MACRRRRTLSKSLGRSRETLTLRCARRTPAWWFFSVTRHTRPRSRSRPTFSTSAHRIVEQHACEREVALNSRLSPNSYLGVAHFTGPHGGPAEPVIVMRRYADGTRLASMVKNGQPVHDQLRAIAETLARFHTDATREPRDRRPGIGWCRSLLAGRRTWTELQRYPDTVISHGAVREVQRLATQFISGRAVVVRTAHHRAPHRRRACRSAG